MLLAVILSYIRWHGGPTSHTVAGIACSLLFAIHFWLNRKMFKVYCKSIKKLNKSTKLRYLIDVLLVVVWSVAIITGFPALGVYTGMIYESAFPFGRLHGVFARLGAVLIIVHVVQHSKQIKSYFTKKGVSRV
jgi:Flp pilus assembly pilin Flp